ncbi:MAG: hypothetical protein QOF25_892 [Mycobacterium sp.]|jgi:hypothetical protein|nr:hypothetical protein [Mycobacterium sp.]
MTVAGTLDTRFGEAGGPTEWGDADGVLEAAELYWLTTVRKDGRPHTTPLVGDVYRAKYGDDWDFAVDDQVFDPGGVTAHVFRVTPSKVLAFGKSPHAQTRFPF